VNLLILESPYRSLIGPLLSYIDLVQRKWPHMMLTVLVPEYVPDHWLGPLLDGAPPQGRAPLPGQCDCDERPVSRVVDRSPAAERERIALSHGESSMLSRRLSWYRDREKRPAVGGFDVNSARASGILLHPTSLPGPYGIGDLGHEAYRFVDFLQQTGQSLWQILPVAPTGHGASPYAAFSAFAGNPLLLSPDSLVAEDLLGANDLRDVPDFPTDLVDYDAVTAWKTALLRRSYAHFKEGGSASASAALASFERENAGWLEDYALFMAVKAAHEGMSWHEWEAGIALRRPEVLARWRAQVADDVRFQKYIQYLFFAQWLALKRYANDHGVQIVGDIPIFVAYDSADVWAHPDLFFLDAQGSPTVVAGVPPDYFSATGQYWGNALYRWDVMAKDGYAWWVERFRNAFRLYDRVRLDHFRGFAAYWEVPVNAEQTAANGRWVTGPGLALFVAVREALGERPIIAEDLGLITPDVVALREALGFPGMRVLQFAFGAEADAANAYLPHNFDRNAVVYTGTHDNDTTLGWYRNAPAQMRANVKDYLDIDERGKSEDVDAMGRVVTQKMVRAAFASVANIAIVPLQDLLELGTAARMNLPGRPDGNWQWRYRSGALTDELGARLRALTTLFARHVPPTGRALRPRKATGRRTRSPRATRQ
jgi:4-alpha-glucanotransferase